MEGIMVRACTLFVHVCFVLLLREYVEHSVRLDISHGKIACKLIQSKGLR